MSFCRIENLRPRDVIENKEDIRLIYLHHDEDDSKHVTKLMAKLRSLNPAAVFYTDVSLCLDLIQFASNEQLILVISDRFASEIPRIVQDSPAIVAVFVHCTTTNDRFAQTQINRDIQIFTDLVLLTRAIQKTMRCIRKSPLAFDLFNQKQVSVRNVTSDSMSFVWYRLLIHVLRKIERDDRSWKEMLTMCSAYYCKDPKELKKIDQFTKEYTSSTALKWYTEECFLYKLLNRALRIEDTLLLYMFRACIDDLCDEITAKKLNVTDSDPLTLYRGQNITSSDMKKLKENIGNLVSFFGFTSTSRLKQIAKKFTKYQSSIGDSQCVLFEIRVDRSLVTTTCTDTAKYSKYPNEQEVLFNLNACFELVSVDFDSRDHLWYVHLTAADDPSADFQKYLDVVEEEISEYTALICYGRLLLWQIGRIDQAETYFCKLSSLHSSMNDLTYASICDHLGHVHNQRDELNQALENYRHAYTVYKKSLPAEHPWLVRSLDQLGTIYERKGELKAALRCYHSARRTLRRHCPDDYLSKAMILASIGIVYRAKGDFDQALTFLSRALDSFEHVLDAPHRQIAQCLGYLGLVCEDAKDFQTALEYYKRQLEMEEEYLTAEHPQLYEHIGWIVRVQLKQGHRDEAQQFCEVQFNRAEQTLGIHHPRTARMWMIKGELFKDEDPHRALDCYEEAALILNHSMTPDDRLLARCYLAKGDLYHQLNMIENAFRCDREAIDCPRHCPRTDHIDLGFALKNLGMTLRAMNDVSGAVKSFEESLSIYRLNYPSKHIAVRLYSRIINDLIEQSPEVHLPAPVIVDQMNELTSPSASTPETNDSGVGMCVIL